MLSLRREMQTELDQVQKTEAWAEAACADDCCVDPPGFAKVYWIGMGSLFGLITIGAVINALTS
jgi:hypothetical protein